MPDNPDHMVTKEITSMSANDWLEVNGVKGYAPETADAEPAVWTQRRIDNLAVKSVLTLQERAANLEQILGNDTWKREPQLLGNDPETLRDHAETLDQIMGNDKWKIQPALLARDPEALRSNAANLGKFFGNNTWKRHPALLSLQPETIRDHILTLDQIMGNDKWKMLPSLLGRDPETLRSNAANLEQIFGNDSWKRQPVLLGRGQAALRSNAANLDKILGNDSWKRQPALLSSSPETIRKSARYLKFLGIEPSKNLHGLMLLSTTWRNKSKKVHFLREKVLGHVKREDRNKEISEREIVETAEFIGNNPRLLLFSLSKLEKDLEKMREKRARAA